MNSQSNNFPLVSIVAICYDHAKYLVETLDSIRGQTYPNIQLIIMNDYSTDNSVEIIKAWIEKTRYPCVFINHTENKGLCKTINEALSLCTGVYYQAIACDDILLKDKISKQVAILEKDTSAALVCSNYQEIDEQGNIIKNEYFSSEYKFPDEPTKAMLSGHNGYGVIVHSPTVLLRLNVFEEVGNYREDIIQEDLDMWLKISVKYKIEYLSDVTVKYRMHPLSLSKNKTTKNRLYIDRLRVGKTFYLNHSEFNKEIDEHQLRYLIFFKDLALKGLYANEEAITLFFDYSSESLKNNDQFRYNVEELFFNLLLNNKKESLFLLNKFHYNIKRMKYKPFFMAYMPSSIPNYLLKIKRFINTI